MSSQLQCPVCDRSWPEKCQQTHCIELYGACIVCRYRDHEPEGMTKEQAESEMSQLKTNDDYKKESQEILEVG